MFAVGAFRARTAGDRYSGVPAAELKGPTLHVLAPSLGRRARLVWPARAYPIALPLHGHRTGSSARTSSARSTGSSMGRTAQ
jgi:hypothetical protein